GEHRVSQYTGQAQHGAVEVFVLRAEKGDRIVDHGHPGAAEHIQMRHAGDEQLVEHPPDHQIWFKTLACHEEPDAGVGHFHDQVIRVHAHHRHPTFTHRGKQHIVVFLIDVVAEEDHQGAVGVEVVVKPAQHRVQPSLSGCGSEP